MSRRLVLLRHGRTAWNDDTRMQGHTDVALDDTGHRQSAVAAAALAALVPDVLWTSDLARARDTAAYLERATGLVAVADQRLREFDVGVRAGMTHAEFERAHPAEYAAWRSGGEQPVVDGAETSSDVRERIVPALYELLRAVPDGGVGVAVTHGACSRVAVGALLGWPESVLPTLRGLDNGAWALLEDDPERGLRLAGWNQQP